MGEGRGRGINGKHSSAVKVKGTGFLNTGMWPWKERGTAVRRRRVKRGF